MTHETPEEARFARAESILEECLRNREPGGSLRIEALVSEHPDLGAELRELWALCDLVEVAVDEGARFAGTERDRAEEMLQQVSKPRSFAERYALEAEIGRGGMGAVFRVLDRKLSRPLAMKVVLREGLAAPGGRTPPTPPRRLARFLNEARITSQLEHPGIVPVHEIGVDQEGRVYFTMKLVQGRNLKEVLEEHARGNPEWTTARILGLIQRVCEAVAFAHGRGVIHRDLKPANVMVGDFGQVYVMDWGLARRIEEAETGSERTDGTGTAAPSEDELVDEQVSEVVTATREGQVVGTPAYMPPEQALGRIAEMGPWSDVYAIGAMLYNLLAGHPPYCGPGETSTATAVIERIKHGPPMRIESRETPPELVAVCERAMAYEPKQRYGNVKELAEDLEAFLTNRVVRAFRRGAWAELETWIRRNRALASSLAGMVVLLVVGLALTANLYKEARDGEAALFTRGVALQAKTEEAREQAERADAVTELLGSMLTEIAPETMGTRLREDVLSDARTSKESSKLPEDEIAAQMEQIEGLLAGTNFTNAAVRSVERNFLEPTLERIEGLDADQPLVGARLKDTVADVYERLGRFEAAVAPRTACLSIRRKLLGEDHSDTIAATSALAVLLHSMGNVSDALPLARDAHERCLRLFGEDDPRTITAGSNVAGILQDQGDYATAERMLRDALERRLRVLGDSHPDTPAAMNNLASLLQARGGLAEAGNLFLRALEFRRRFLGEDHPDSILSANNLALLLKEQGELIRAEELFRDVLERSRRVLGDDHPTTLAARNNLALTLKSLAQLPEAEEQYHSALELSRRMHGPDHPMTIKLTYNLGAVLLELGRHDEAEKLFRDALDRSRRVLGGEHPITAISMSWIATALQRQGKFLEAEPLFREALDCRLRVLGEDHPDSIASTLNLAGVFLDQQRVEDAEPLLEDALERSRRALPEKHPTTIAVARSLARVRELQGRFADAEPLLRFALDRATAVFGTDSPRTRGLRDNLIRLYESWHAVDPNGGHADQAQALKETPPK